MPSAAAIYARISDDREGLALGVARQLRDCHALAREREWPVLGEYVDNDSSAYRGGRRPEYRRLIGDIADGVVDALVVWHLDRLHSQPSELEEFFQVIDQAGGLALASVSGAYDLSTSDGQFHARILGAVARKESDDKSRRIRRKHMELAEAGRVSGGGSRPFGFEADRITVRPAEAAIIRDLAARFLAGESLYSLLASLNEHEVRTSTGGPWSHTSLRRLLRSARISGRRDHRGRITATAVWPPIISTTDSDRIRAVLDDPKRRRTRPSRRYLLAGGLLRCHRCGAPMISRPRQDGAPRYICPTGRLTPSCGGTFIMAEPVDELIVEAVFYRLDTPEVHRALSAAGETEAESALETAIAEDQEQLDELAAMYGRREFSAREWAAARRVIEDRIATARRRLHGAHRSLALTRDFPSQTQLRRTWPTLPLGRQQAIVATILDHATIGPAVRGWNRFDQSRVMPVWRV